MKDGDQENHMQNQRNRQSRAPAARGGRAWCPGARNAKPGQGRGLGDHPKMIPGQKMMLRKSPRKHNKVREQER